jgi:hypothetical protein
MRVCTGSLLLMSEVTDSEIVSALRPILTKTKERAAMAEVAERLRWATDPAERSERDRCGNRMAELDLEISQMSVTALDQIGLWHAAGLIEQTLSQSPTQ